jgi:hypothetical protein
VKAQIPYCPAYSEQDQLNTGTRLRKSRDFCFPEKIKAAGDSGSFW